MKSLKQFLKEDPSVHPFERRGLGHAPYRYEGFDKKVAPGQQGLTVDKPGSTCDYCGTAIMYTYFFTSADGKKFKVGSECMLKGDTQDYAIYDTTPGRAGYCNLKDIVAQEKKKIDKLNATKKNQSEGQAAQQALESHAARLRNEPHPKGFAGKTAYDYYQWMLSKGMYKQILSQLK